MYLEENDPTLEAAILSAVEATSRRRRSEHGHSPHLVEKLVEQAIEQCRALDHGMRDRARRRCSATRARSAASPPSPRCSSRSARRTCGSGLSALLDHLAQRRSVEPVQHRGHARQHEGAARRRSDGEGEAGGLHRRTTSTLMMRTRSDAASSSACRSSPARDPARSRACCSTSRSRPSTTSSRTASARRTFTLDGRRSADRRASSMLEYRFPAYTGLPPRNGRTGRRRRRDPRHRSRAARHADDDDAGRPDSAERRRRAAADAGRPTARSTGNFKIERAGLLPIELDGPARREGRTRRRSTRSTCSTISRRRCTSTSRDATRRRARSKKCSLEARADDDFGVKQLQLFYSVNGGAEKTINLFGGAQAAAPKSAPATRSTSRSSA